MSDVKQLIFELVERAKIHRSCLSCAHFDEDNEKCLLFNVRPPARVIAMGCDNWVEPPPF